MTGCKLLRTLLCLSIAGNFQLSQAFIVSPGSSSGSKISTIQAIFTSPTQLLAKKKRRRRKKTNSQDVASDSASENLPDFDFKDDSLPDFDLNEEDEPVPSPKSKIPAMGDINYTEITDAMMGDSSAPTQSLSELISDRSLESKFEFDDTVVDKSIPDFTDFAAMSDTTPQDPVLGKKKARQAERRANAIQAREAEEETKLDLPFVTDEKGNFSTIKFLEAGAWAGIGLLVIWEVYINSPLFNRAAPMAPVVFELYM
jgi:hypothetical protein